MFVRPAIASEAYGHRRARMSPGHAARVDPREFGRGMQRNEGLAPSESRLSDDLRLFATTFLLGFIFVSAFLA